MRGASHPQGSHAFQREAHRDVLAPRRWTVEANRVVEVARVEEVVASHHPLRMPPGEVRDAAVQTEDRKPVAPSGLVQEVKHPDPAGEDVGVGCRGHPRNEHGGDYHEEWESPIGHRSAPKLPNASCSLTPSATSSRHFDGDRTAPSAHVVLLRRNLSQALRFRLRTRSRDRSPSSQVVRTFRSSLSL